MPARYICQSVDRESTVTFENGILPKNQKTGDRAVGSKPDKAMESKQDSLNLETACNYTSKQIKVNVMWAKSFLLYIKKKLNLDVYGIVML